MLSFSYILIYLDLELNTFYSSNSHYIYLFGQVATK